MADKSTNALARTMEPGIVQRVAQGIRYAITGKTPDWFGPLAAIDPIAPQVEGRQFDFPVGYNLQIRPRAYEPVTFEELRALADNYTLIRLAIETRKDQLVKLNWAVTYTDEAKANRNDERINKLTEFWQSPDREHSWQQWLRMIIEDMLVIDAATLYPRKTKGGELYSLEPVDGATIKRVIDSSGRTPLPPEPAYQQILKGLPAVNYSTDELIYYPRNVRTNRIYGMSPVEQVIMIINIGLRRDLSQLQYYTEGNIPDAFGFLPSEWTPDQVKQFQSYWDSFMEGNAAQRRKMKFLPGGNSARIEQLRDPKLKDEYDEWLARVICYCFSLPPLPFVKQMNRATAQSDIERAKEEGLQPVMQWVEDLCNFCMQKFMGVTDIVWRWKEEDDIDPLIRAQINQMKITNGVMSRNEWRLRDGEGPIPGGDAYTITTNMGIQLLADIIEAPEPEAATLPPKPSPDEQAPAPGNNAEKLEKARPKIFRVINPNRLSAIRATREIKKTCRKFFKAEQSRIVEQLSNAIADINKADEDIIARIMREVDLSGWSVLVDPTAEQIEAIYAEAGRHGIKNLKTLDLPTRISTEGMTELVNKSALNFARNRAAELVGKKWIGGELVDNPNAAWAITDSTRDMLREKIVQAIEEGWSPKHLANEIEASGMFGEDRAELIARTEIKRADNEGNMQGYRASGLPLEKRWVLSADHPDEDDCDDNAEAGWIDLDDLFPAGDDAPGNHPNCMCSLEVRVKKEDQ